MTHKGELEPPRYCAECGLSLVPLSVPHVARSCAACGKTVHVAEPGEGGQGIRVQKGDKFIIPAGYLSFSLDPAVGGKLYRPGLTFLVSHLLNAGSPKTPEEMQSLLDSYKTVADEVLRKTEELAGLDLETAEGTDKAFEILKEKKDTHAWYAFVLGAFCEIAAEAIEEGAIEKAAWAVHKATVAHSLTVVTEPIFEQTLWRGYLANSAVYEAASAASITPGEADAIRALEPLFHRLDEATLHAWVESGLPIGPRIGVTKLPEPIILALAKFHLAGFQRKREEERRSAEDARFIRDLRTKWAAVGVAASSAIVAILKATGVL